MGHYIQQSLEAPIIVEPAFMDLLQYQIARVTVLSDSDCPAPEFAWKSSMPISSAVWRFQPGSVKIGGT